jgi:HEAT repeat protein
VVLSLWDVPDRSTADLMAAFYERLKGDDVAVALQRAQQAVAARHPAPWHWAAFVVYGDWAPAVASESDLRVRDIVRELKTKGRGASPDLVAELERLGPKAAAAVPRLVKLLDLPQGHPLHAAALRALVTVGPQAAPALIARMEHSRSAPRKEATRAFLALGPEAMPALARALAEGKNRVVHALQEMGQDARPTLPTLIAALDGDQRRVRTDIVRLLGKLPQEAGLVVPALVKVLSDPSDDVREAAVWAFFYLGPIAKAALPALEKVRDADPKGKLQELAGMAIRKLTQ